MWYLILKKIVKTSGNSTQNRRTSLQKRAKDVSMEFTLVWYACNSQWSYFDWKCAKQSWSKIKEFLNLLLIQISNTWFISKIQRRKRTRFFTLLKYLASFWHIFWPLFTICSRVPWSMQLLLQQQCNVYALTKMSICPMIWVIGCQKMKVGKLRCSDRAWPKCICLPCNQSRQCCPLSWAAADAATSCPDVC